ncbi:hypothetical protein LCGC14_0832220 [marine sediment metagenome]|uniref:Uncharacterized protein n=1 Tax=marine sediment metagenome TaxID=412755 RepID=A0A0F9SMT4_9ZZZZ
MAILPSSLDFTDRDFDSLNARLDALLASVFPDWTDFQVATFGNILKEMFAFVGGVFTKYQDSSAIESRIVTATQRKNLINLAKLVGFVPQGAAVATAEETFTLAAVPTQDVVFVEGQEVRTKDVVDPATFRLLTDLTIPAFKDPPIGLVQVENADPTAEQFQSDGLANQRFELAEVPFLDDSAVILAANGDYDEVVNFLDSAAADRHFVIVVDQNDRATIKFGNGVNGAIPQGTIAVSYKTGGGAAGNVEVGTITTIEGSFTDILGGSVSVSVNNAAKASGGTDRQGNEEIRELAPESVRVLNRTVAREDYEINAKKIAGVSRALMLTADQDTEIDENAGKLFIIPDGGGVPTQTLKDSVLNQVTVVFPKTVTFRLDVVDPVFLVVNVAARVFKRTNITQATVRANIQAALDAHFALDNPDGSANTNIDFGFNFKDVDGNPAGEIAWSDIFNVVRDASGVRKIGDQNNDLTLNGQDDDLPIQVKQFPVLGQIVLLDGDTGGAF